MAYSNAVKKNLSSMQVLKTLEVLVQGNYTMSELIVKLNKQEPEPVFNNSVISKYINTCRYCGIDIPKIQNRYFVTNLPFGLNLNTEEKDLLTDIQRSIRENMSSGSNRVFDKFLEKINKFANKQIVRIEKNSSKYFQEAFELAIEKQRKVKLLFKAKAEMECSPINISSHKGKTYFNVLFKNKERMIAEERLAGIEILLERIREMPAGQPVIYRLKGDLADRYTLKESETILTKNSNELVVSNNGENREILFSRLLRYDSSCEILEPKEYREEMKQIISAMLKNYGV